MAKRKNDKKDKQWSKGTTWKTKDKQHETHENHLHFRVLYKHYKDKLCLKD